MGKARTYYTVTGIVGSTKDVQRSKYPTLRDAKSGAADLIWQIPDIEIVLIDCYQSENESKHKEAYRSVVNRFGKLSDWEIVA